MKKTLAIILVLAFFLPLLAGCGGGGGVGGGAPSGKYIIDSIEVGGVNMLGLLTLGGVTKDSIYLEFAAGGRFKMVASNAGMSEDSEGTYKISGNTITFDMDSIEVPATISGNKITIDMDGVKMVFKKK